VEVAPTEVVAVVPDVVAVVVGVAVDVVV